MQSPTTTPCPYHTHFLVHTPSWTTTVRADAHSIALSVSREKSPIQWDSRPKWMHKAVIVSVTFSTAPMNTTSQVHCSCHQGHLCLIMSLDKLLWGQGKAGNVSIHLAALQPLALDKQPPMYSLTSGCRTCTSSSLHYQVRGCPLSCTWCNVIFQNSFMSPNKHPPLTEDIPALLPNKLQQRSVHLYAFCTWECCQSLYGYREREHGEREIWKHWLVPLARFLANGTKEVVKVKPGSATRPHFLEEYTLE